MTEQEAFDKSVAGLVSQGFERSGRSYGTGAFACLYNGERPDTHCALGWLIPEDQYNEDFDTSCYNTEKVVKTVSVFAGAPLSFWAALQDCHDEGRTPEAMKSNLREFARANNLRIPESLA